MGATHFQTLVDMLDYRAAHSPDAVAFTFSDHAFTYAELWQRINGFGRYFQDLKLLPGDRIVLALPNGPEFFAALYGGQRAGYIPVPLFPGSGAERILSIARLCGSKLVIVPSSMGGDQLTSLKKLGDQQGIHVAAAPESAESRLNREVPKVSPDDLALIQYTSGSTGNPKGVQLTHHNVLTNIGQMIKGMQITKDDKFVTWLPVYHDLGLILMTMAPFNLGAELHLLPANLKDVRPWLQTIEAQRATFTAAPDFAYRLCVRYVQPGAYDLTTLRVALNAAEPVRAQTLREFEQAFGLKDVMVAGYGLAEATVGVSMWPPNTAARVDKRGFVSVGPPFPDVELQIIHNGKPVLPGQIGEITIRSRANSQGYLNNPAATRQLIQPNGYLRSGDLGYLDADGYLFVTGRMKNIIKLSGETIWPQEVEELVDNHRTVRYSAAIGVDRKRTEGEQVFVFAEIRAGDSKSESELHDIAVDIVNTLHSHLGFRPGRVYLLKSQTIPLTYNGKIQHKRLKAQYLDGSLREGQAILYPEF